MERFQFSGNGSEYFKIWIVNIFLTIITFGIYYPWARVRNNKYLYTNSIFKETNFDYHAIGKQLFLGYLIALVGFIIYKVVETISPTIGTAIIIVFFLSIPWLIWRSMKFSLNVTSFNNIKFNFNGGVKKSYVIFLGIPLLFVVAYSVIIMALVKINNSMITGIGVICLLALLVLLSAYFSFIKANYIINSSKYGTSPFYSDLRLSEFVKIMFKTILIAILAFLLLEVIVLAISYGLMNIEEITATLKTYKDDTESNQKVLLTLLLPFIVAGYIAFIFSGLIVHAYYNVKQRNYIFANTILNNDVKLASHMKFIPYAIILITNALLVFCTLGLAYPWAKVRVMRYTLSNTAIEVQGGLNGYFHKENKESGFGDQVSDTLGVDIGVPI